MFAAISVRSSPMPDFDVRTEVQPVDERRRLEVPAEIKLIGVNRDAAADAGILRQRREWTKTIRARVKTTDLLPNESQNASCIPPAG